MRRLRSPVVLVQHSRTIHIAAERVLMTEHSATGTPPPLRAITRPAHRCTTGFHTTGTSPHPRAFTRPAHRCTYGLPHDRHTAASTGFHTTGTPPPLRAFTNRGRSSPWSRRRSDTIEAEGLAWNTKYPANALVVVTPRLHHCRVVFSMLITRRVLRPRSCRIGAPTKGCSYPGL